MVQTQFFIYETGQDIAVWSWDNETVWKFRLGSQFCNKEIYNAGCKTLLEFSEKRNLILNLKLTFDIWVGTSLLIFCHPVDTVLHFKISPFLWSRIRFKIYSTHSFKCASTLMWNFILGTISISPSRLCSHSSYLQQSTYHVPNHFVFCFFFFISQRNVSKILDASSGLFIYFYFNPKKRTSKENRYLNHF